MALVVISHARGVAGVFRAFAVVLPRLPAGIALTSPAATSRCVVVLDLELPTDPL
jgi:hypothetical protein